MAEKNNDMININIRVDKNIKSQFESICNGLGLTMTTALTMCMQNTIRQNGLGFLDLTLKSTTTKEKENE